MFGLIKKVFGLLTGLVTGSNHAKYVLLTNQKCTTQPTLINLHPNESKTEDSNLSVFNMITDINELKTLTKQISY